jgi:hypothetical protein
MPMKPDENMWEEVNRVATKKVSPRKPATKKAAKSSKKAATRVTKKALRKAVR